MRDRPVLIRFVAVALLLYSMAALCSAVLRMNEAEKAYAVLREEVSVLQTDNVLLSERLASGLTDSEIEALARERLGLVMPGERIFYFN